MDMNWNIIIFWLIVCLIVYWAYFIYWGVKSKRLITEANTARDYFIASRSLGPRVFILATTATCFSAWTFMSHPGLIYWNGFQSAYASFYAIVIPFTGVLFLKRQWILGKRYGFVTPGEMFYEYFNKSDAVRMLVVLVAVLFSVLYIAVQMRASGLLFKIITHGGHGTEILGMWALSIVMIIYVVLGGLRAVAHVDEMQFVLLAAGIVIIGIVVLNEVGWTLNQGIAILSEFDPTRTSQSYSHYIAIPDVMQPVWHIKEATAGGWTSTFILTFMFALMGIQSSPDFSMWAFSSKTPKPFFWQQVIASALIMGLIMFVFTATQGFSGHLLGVNSEFKEAHLNDPVKDIKMTITKKENDPVMDIPVMDIKMTITKKEDADTLVPYLILLIAKVSWLGDFLVSLLAICALAAMQSTAAPYLSTIGGILTRDALKRYESPAKQIMVGRIAVVVIAIIALFIASIVEDTLALLGGLAVAYGLQMWPALIGLCWLPFLTWQGIAGGLLTGIIVVTITDNPGGIFGEYWPLRWPLTIHSAGWGIASNFLVAFVVSCFTQNSEERKHRETFHSFLKEHASLPNEKKWLKPIAWIVTILWFFFAIGPGAILGNDWIGNPNDSNTWWFGIPPIWSWQIVWWLMGVGMMWFLAYYMEMSTMSDDKSEKVVALQEDVSEPRDNERLPRIS